MFSLKITDTDVFLEMPVSSQLLYFHLNMHADDDGFVSSPRKIMKTICCGEDDLKVLLSKRYVLGFPSGIVVIKHWRMHNLLRKDRYTSTDYIEEKSLLQIKDNGSYTDKQPTDTLLATKRQPPVPVGKVRKGKVSIVKESDFEDLWKRYKNKDGRKDALRYFKKSVITKDDLFNINKALNNYNECKKVKAGFIKNGSTWFNNWNDWVDYIETDPVRKERAMV